jgi:hypothetical protein
MYLILMVQNISSKFSFEMFFCYLENQQLDRQEYNLWTIRTTGEEITEQDWLSIRGRRLIN